MKETSLRRSGQYHRLVTEANKSLQFDEADRKVRNPLLAETVAGLKAELERANRVIAEYETRFVI